MSERPKWMPTEQELEDDRALDDVSLQNCPEAMKRNYRTGLRAQLAAWEEMQSMFNGPSLQVIFRERIAALRKELGQ